MELIIKKLNKETTLIDMQGKFGIEDETEFQKKLNKLLKSKMKFILFNFAKLNYIDSTGVGSIIKIMNLSKASNVEIYLYSLPDHIFQVFKSDNLDGFLKIKTLDEMRIHFPELKLK